ncbi:LytR/AlgR family response regulator transcription factor [Methylogaea oryzae]|uniref:DNA-binding response regulator n=1 Tax=Methylogaea oryzae TaxID=1295382 RepID=A0A8D4VTC5_9GAMM|nr:LytTR family DNA-binding domain-containing protein [Methylogaea oryzae]BBL72154.1 DNA-binding response regulator [Methylogaea oryzae]
MRILIVDDEAPARRRLQDLLAETAPEAAVVGEAADGASALLAWAETRPDLVLLDIRMPLMDGLETARELARMDEPPAVVFVTAYDEHALAAFDLNAVDYLLKPVRKERLALALGKARRFGAERWEQLQRDLPAAPRSHICVRQQGNLRLIPLEEIRCFSADMKYTTLYTAKEEALIDDSLKSLEEEFPDRFLRVHRNALVALAHIVALEKSPAGTLRVRLAGLAEPVEVSRRHASAARQRLRRLEHERGARTP